MSVCTLSRSYWKTDLVDTILRFTFSVVYNSIFPPLIMFDFKYLLFICTTNILLHSYNDDHDVMSEVSKTVERTEFANEIISPVYKLISFSI